MSSIAGTNKKKGLKGRGRPFVGSTSLNVRVHPSELASLDAYIAAQPDPKPSRPEAIRALLREGLVAKGVMREAER